MATSQNLNLKQKSEQVGPGTIVLSVDSTKKSPSVVLKSSGVTITGNNPGIGISVDDTGVSIQGKVNFLSSGTGLTKGNYSENPNSASPYTATETIQAQAVIQGKLYSQLAAQGVDTSAFAESGIAPPIVTDIAGTPPHVHTISLKHVHAVQPAYLYKMSPLLTNMNSALSGFQAFLSM